MEEVAMPARFPRRPSLTLVGAVALVVAMANPAAAPPGDLDLTFGGDGKVTTDFAGGQDQASAAAIQGDGKIVTAGAAFVSGNLDFAVARYNPDGSLDSTFSGDGKVTTDFAGSTDEAFAVALQGDGKIVVGGGAFVSGSHDFALARYNTDGSLDATFSGDGKVTTDFAGARLPDRAFDVALQADGRIVAAGFAFVSGTTDFALTRYNPDGSLDPTFSGDGKVTTDFAGSTDEVFDVALQADGRIVAAGFAGGVGGPDFAVARYDADGSLDPTFSGDGKVTTDFAGSTAQAIAVAIQANGRIVAAGFAQLGTNDFALARYNPDGTLDATFDGDGKVSTDFAGSTDQAFGMAIQTNGKIVAAGFAQLGTNDFALARYNADGSLDPTFSGDGKVTTDFAGSTDGALAVAIQTNGRIVAAGGADVSGNQDFALARYTCLRRTSRPMSIPLCP
jgi:uncharacterized delta-60 repeat protein